jgi:hypothetical protein
MLRRGRGQSAGSLQYSWKETGHELLLAVADPNRFEVEAVRDGSAQFAVVCYQGVIFFLCRFGAAHDWSAAAFSIHLNGEKGGMADPPGDTDPCGTFLVRLVDSSTQEPVVSRTISLSRDFASQLNKAIRDQAARAFSAEAYEAAVAAANRLWQHIDDMSVSGFAMSVSSPRVIGLPN